MPPITSPFARIMGNLPPLIPKPEPVAPPPGAIDATGLSGATGGSALPAFPSSTTPKVVKGKFDPSTASPEDVAMHPLLSRLSSDEEKDLNPWGTPQNHPGFLGKLGHALSVATGGPNRRQYEEMGLQKSLQDLLNSQTRNKYETAETAHTEAETPEVAPNAESTRKLQGAETEHLGAETNALENPQPEYDVHDTAEGPMVVNKKTGVGQHLSVNGLPVGPKVQTRTVQLEIGGKPHQVLINDADGTVIRDIGESGEKPPTVNVNAGNAEMDREATRLGKPYEKGVSDANAQLEKIADARAMVNGNAESQALGIPKVLTALVSGQGSGVRITQAELNMIGKARGLSGDVEGTINKWAGKGALSAAQKQQLTQILDDVKTRLEKKAAVHSEALDAINGATNRQQIIDADKQARQRLQQIEKYGHYEGEQVTVKGQPVTIRKIHPDGSFE